MHNLRLIAGFSCVALFLTTSAAAQGSLTTADSVSLLIAAYGTALNNGLRTAADKQPGVVCVDGLSDSLRDDVLTALRDSTQRLLRPVLACRVEPLRSSVRGRSLVVDTLTGNRGIIIHATILQMADNGTFAFRTSYYEHGSSGADWNCEGQKRGQFWAVVSCRLTRIS